jgi:hypothetical protein
VNLTLNKDQSLEHVLESAIVVSWPDLMHGNLAGLVHVEYGFASAGTLEYLKVWSSLTRGHWLLACEYWMSASTLHGVGVHFDNGYESKGLAQILESVMQQQAKFSLPPDLGRQGLLQISTPTEPENKAAAALVSQVQQYLGSHLSAPVLA